MSNDFDVAMESFPWESEDQRKGYLALVQYQRKFGLSQEMIDATAAFFIQKDVDSHAYWRELVGTQVTDLQNILAETRMSLDQAKSSIAQLEMTVRAQMAAIEALTKK